MGKCGKRWSAICRFFKCSCCSKKESQKIGVHRECEGGEWKTVTTQTVYTTEGGKTVKKVITTEQTGQGGNGLSEEFENALTFPDNDDVSRTEKTKTTEKKPGFLSKFTSGKTDKGVAAAAASPGSASSSPQSASEFAQDCLKSHNTYRAKHGVPLITLNKKICDYAQEWANKLAKENKFEHRTERKYGENIFMKWSSNPNAPIAGSEAVESWYSEIKDHKFGQEPRSLASGHFTQVIWKECKEMGVGMARNNGNIIVVANYDPPGNMMG
jgi:uncharacterized protein YkwD